jgi:hypothetical protein
MEAAGTSEPSVNFYQTFQRNNPEDSHFMKHTIRKPRKTSTEGHMRPAGREFDTIALTL